MEAAVETLLKTFGIATALLDNCKNAKGRFQGLAKHATQLHNALASAFAVIKDASFAIAHAAEPQHLEDAVARIRCKLTSVGEHQCQCCVALIHMRGACIHMAPTGLAN